MATAPPQPLGMLPKVESLVTGTGGSPTEDGQGHRNAGEMPFSREGSSVLPPWFSRRACVPTLLAGSLRHSYVIR